MSARTILISGASGFVGSNLVNCLRKRHKVIAAFNRSILPFPGVSHTMFSLTDRNYMKRVFMLLKPDVMIYCAGITDLVDCAKRPQTAEAVNTMGAVALSQAADTVPHRLIYLSSAYVYDGKKGNFSEEDVVLPETQFGKGKLAGENFIRAKISMYTIFRFSPLIGSGSIYHPSVVDQIRMKLQRGEQVELPQNEMHSFLALETAMQSIEWAATQETRNATYNFGGLTKLSWYDFGVALAEKLGFDPRLVMPGKGQMESGGDFSLNGTELIRESEIQPLFLEQSLDLFQQQLVR